MNATTIKTFHNILFSETNKPSCSIIVTVARISNITTIVFLTIFFYIFYQYFLRIRRYPAGPLPFPIIGNLLQIDIANPHRSMVKWQKKYGNIFTVWLPKPTIIVAEWKELQNMLMGLPGERCLDRPASYVYGIFTQHKPEGDGIILCSGAKWRTQRNFALNAFKNFGMGGSKMEDKINMHKDALIYRLAYENSSDKKSLKYTEPIVIEDLHSHLAFCFGNIIHDLVMGRHYKYNDAEFLRFKKHIDMTLKRVASVPMLIIDCYPWMRFFFPQYYQYLKDGYAIQNFFLKEIERHAVKLDINNKPTNFIDAYLQEMFCKDDLHLSQLTLALDAGDLWTGGLETVVTTLTWAIIYLIHNTEIQSQLYAELDLHLRDEPFRMNDRQNLPFLRATIDEVQRIVNVLPWHIPRAINCNITLNGKVIPSGSTIMPQFGAVHFNENLFPNPETFLPTRFLKKIEESEQQVNESINLLQKNETKYNKNNNEQHQKLPRPAPQQQWKYVSSEFLAPFGIGKRACLGEGLGRMELFIVLAGLLQNFRFEAFDKDNLPSLERSPGMTSTAKPFKCRIIRRTPTIITTLDESLVGKNC